MNKPDNIEIYDANARQLVARYESTTTEKALAPFTRILKQYDGTDRSALDIGSGSGRDAAWLAEHGWHVDAVDGSTALLEEAEKLHGHAVIHFMHDLAPDFSNVRALNKRYDVILMSAFIFHFDAADREVILAHCAGILSADGLIYITLRQGPVVPDRHIYAVAPDEIETFAQNHGLSSHYHGRVHDSAGLGNVMWDHISLWRGAAWDHAKEYAA